MSGQLGTFRSHEDRERVRAAYELALSHCPAPEETHDVPTSFGTVRVYRWGTAAGTPVVLFPGSQATSAMWGQVVPGLTSQRAVYALDMIGDLGGSVQTAPVRNGHDAASWVAQAFSELDVDRMHAVGTSAGGWLALQFAADHPSRVASLTLLEPAGLFARFSPRFLGGIVTAQLDRPRGTRARFIDRLVGTSGQGSRALRDLVTAGFTGFRSRLPMPGRATQDQAGALTMPVTVIFGADSFVHRSSAAAAHARRLLPKARVEVWPGVGHAITDQAVEAVHRCILETAGE